MKEKKKKQEAEFESVELDPQEMCQCECEQESCECEHHNQEHECCHGKNHKHECCHGHNEESEQYLAMAQRLQADFENYRKRVAEQLDFQRQEGVKSVIEVFLPCLDTFKEAKKSIGDESVMMGINMIEDKILQALKSLKVEKIEAVGKVYDPHLHNVIAVMTDLNKENDTILEEYQSGWTMNGKVIRYSQVVVNKLS